MLLVSYINSEVRDGWVWVYYTHYLVSVIVVR